MAILHPIALLLKKLLEIILAVSLAVLGLSILAQIVLREVFSNAFLPMDDIIPYSFSLSTFAGAGLLFGEGGHIAITVFIDIMPEGVRKAVRIFAGVVTVLFLLFVVYFGYEFMLDGGYQYSPLLNIRLCYVYFIVPLSALSALVFLVAGRENGSSRQEQ